MQYLRTGRVAGKAQAGGMMAEAVENSFQLMPETDLRAIAAYLKSTAPVGESAADSKRPAGTAYGQGRAASDEARRRGMDSQTATASLKSGAALFSGYCASCHQSSGAGSANQAYPSLFHNTATGAGTAANLVATILYGIDRNVGDQHVLMPRFDQKSYVNPLTNQQVADISNTCWRATAIRICGSRPRTCSSPAMGPRAAAGEGPALSGAGRRCRPGGAAASAAGVAAGVQASVALGGPAVLLRSQHRCGGDRSRLPYALQ